MNFTDIFIRRPVFATVVSLLILLIGIRSYFSLTTRLFPRIDMSAVTITTSYPGADAELMEGFVTTPIENSLGGVDGIDYMSSSSTIGQSLITIYFQVGYDINAAMSDVNAKVNSVRYLLPTDIYDPVISKNDPNAYPAVIISFLSKALSLEEITDYVNRVVQPQIQTLPGVATAQVWGWNYAMRVWLKPPLMAANNVTPADVYNALTGQSLQAPAGKLKSTWQTMGIKLFSEATTAEEFDQIVIKDTNNTLTRIKDIGRSELGAQTTDIGILINGNAGVGMGIIPISTANPLDIAAEIYNILPAIVKALPHTIKTEVVWDSSKFISASIKEVKKTIVESSLCVILIVFLFLGSWRTLIIPTVTIPLSLVGVCGVMYALNYSLNTITFLSMVLAIGMVVDDAIVVAENIYRNIAAGNSPFDSALKGAREIQFAIIAMTFTLAAVYAPIGFLTGLIGSLFKEFAFTLAFAVIISGFIALTLSPMMCSKIMSAQKKPGGMEERVEKIFNKVLARYRQMLENTLQHRKKMLAIIPSVLLVTGLLYLFIPSELAPHEDMGYIIVVGNSPNSANIDYTVKYANIISSLYESIPEKDNYVTVSGYPTLSSIMSYFILKSWDERKRGVDQIIAELMPKIWTVPGVAAFPINPPTLPSVGGGLPVQLVLQSIGDYKELFDISQKLLASVSSNYHLPNPQIAPKFDAPQLNIKVNRNKAGDLGIKMQDIGSALSLALSESYIGHFGILGRSYEVIPELESSYRNRPDVLNNLYLRTGQNTLVPLSNIVSLTENVQPQSIDHFQQVRSITISAAMIPGYTLGQALKFLQDAVKKTVPDNIQINYSGELRQYVQTSGQMLITFIFAVIFIFLVLAAQFESFRDPFIVLFTIPLSLFGAMLALFLSNNTINIYSEIGFVTLVGLISKHGILMVEFANQLQEQGKNIHDAIVEAAAIRLRPILMTTAAMVLGALPLVFATGAGAISRHQIGWTIVGGMTIGTMFTLFIVPTVYTFIATKKSAV